METDTLVVPDVMEKILQCTVHFLKTFLRLKHSEVGDVQLYHSLPMPCMKTGISSNGGLLVWAKSNAYKMGLTFTNWKKKIAISTVNSDLETEMEL